MHTVVVHIGVLAVTIARGGLFETLEVLGQKSDILSILIVMIVRWCVR